MWKIFYKNAIAIAILIIINNKKIYKNKKTYKQNIILIFYSSYNKIIFILLIKIKKCYIKFVWMYIKKQ